jgi:hypothetical protein
VEGPIWSSYWRGEREAKLILRAHFIGCPGQLKRKEEGGQLMLAKSCIHPPMKQKNQDSMIMASIGI